MRQATRRKPKCEPSCTAMSHLDVRIAQYATTSPAWGERTGRCGVWDKWKTHNRTFWGIAEAMAEQRGMPPHPCALTRTSRSCRRHTHHSEWRMPKWSGKARLRQRQCAEWPVGVTLNGSTRLPTATGQKTGIKCPASNRGSSLISWIAHTPDGGKPVIYCQRSRVPDPRS